MPASHKPREYVGLTKGLEWRESHQDEHHSEIAVNVDYSRGYVEGRKPFGNWAASSVPARARLHLTDDPNRKRYLLAVGPNALTGSTSISCSIYDLDGTNLGTVNLTTTGGELPDDDFQCSFVDTSIPRGTNEPNFVTLITTRHNTWVFEPYVDNTTVRRINSAKIASSGDTIRINDVNFAYWTGTPHVRGAIASEHQGRIYYAGFEDNTDVLLSSTLETDQNQVPEQIISTGRSKLRLGPHHVAYSDEFDPGGIQAHHVFSVEERERITGLVSFKEQLVVFTDESIYVMTGGTDQTFALYKAVTGVGCVAPGSIVDVFGTLFFLSHDGVYAWTGGDLPLKMSAPIDAFFTGEYSRTSLPEDALSNSLTALKYPWRVEHGDLFLSQSLHYQEANQVWWSLPVNKRETRAYPVTLVWDYVHNAWSMYTMSPAANSDVTPMFDGVSLKSVVGRERVFTSGMASGTAKIQQYGVDGKEDSSARAVPVTWMSATLNPATDGANKYRKVRLKILSVARDTELASGPRWIVTGDGEHNDVEESIRPSRSQTMQLHDNAPGGFFWDVGVWDTMKWATRDWFGSNTKSATSSSYLRVGFVDDATTTNRSPIVVLKSFSVEGMPGKAQSKPATPAQGVGP